MSAHDFWAGTWVGPGEFFSEESGGMKLSVVIPVYNEEATLEEIVRRVQAAP